MSSPKIQLTAITNFSHKLLPRSHAKVSRAASFAAMNYHWQHHLPRHFENDAPKRYGYHRRTSSLNVSQAFLKRNGLADTRRGRVAYETFKRLQNLKPLTWSGQTRGMVTNPFFRKITTHKERGGKLEVKTPAYVSSRLKPRPSGESVWSRGRQMAVEALKRAAEMEAMTAKEIDTLQKVWRAEYIDITKNPAHPLHKEIVQFRRRARRRK